MNKLYIECFANTGIRIRSMGIVDWFSRTLLAAISAIIFCASTTPAIAADDPHEAILAAVKALRDNDFHALVVSTVGNEEYDKLAKEWIEERDKREIEERRTYRNLCSSECFKR